MTMEKIFAYLVTKIIDKFGGSYHDAITIGLIIVLLVIGIGYKVYKGNKK